ncbi:phosphate ABC transporter ATP-binding protein [Syntrophotalea acetylenivorans]|uniref:Phosphate ABC transporter ATP-binding protein n=1 Tax=Syntrophotalea acetylenivorans TaxID=1842532 RepID=A0A1L3GNR4_9BACT|nr:phosphate ABC transporter ATP-binding protein [Syntrophotalea acetylenivorans]APG27562.1 phosphate ABC transporter ATP-binding protein [Syntrophotalea acetylenivorans]
MTPDIKIRVADLNFAYRDRTILRDVSLEFAENTITALTGSSGAGKSTFLMTLNRLWENISDAKMQGTVEIKLQDRFRDIYAADLAVTELRKMVAMVFQVPNPLPMSIRKNIAFPLKLSGERNRESVDQKIEQALKMANLWDEVKDRLNEDARNLSGGQQQRLCIARALVLEPEVLLLDEPTSSLDQASTAVIEELLLKLKDRLTILIVSHHPEQVDRIADKIIQFGDSGIVSTG